MLVEGDKFGLAIVSHQVTMMFDPKKAADVNPFEMGKSLITKAKVRRKKRARQKKQLDGKRKLAKNCVQQYTAACVHALPPALISTI